MGKAENKNSSRRLLSQWDPPEDAGNPVGVLATTFTLDTALFEEECLARFAGVQSDPLRDGALYRIEREEKLSALICAVVIADVHHCSGLRSLRWDLLASRPEAGVMHAKISLLAWENHVRAIVASANVTNSGYRQNQECAAVLDFSGSGAERTLLDPLLDFLHEILDTTTGPAKTRAAQLLEWVSAKFERSDPPSRGLQRRLILISPGRKNVFDQLVEHLPESRPEIAHVVSPFFDQELRRGGPEQRIWEMMRQRGDAEVHLHVAAIYASEIGKWRLQAPEHLLHSKPGTRSSTTLSLHPLQVNNVSTDTGKEHRPLHAKTLTFCHAQWIASMVGSSNFTSAGTGLASIDRNTGKALRVVNFEANVLYYVNAASDDQFYRQIADACAHGADAVDVEKQAQFDPSFGQEDGEGDIALPLPAFFAGANLTASTTSSHHLEIQLDTAKTAPDNWTVASGDKVLQDGSAWRAAGKRATIALSLERHGPPPAQLAVEWRTEAGSHKADLPVNAISASVLPAPDDLHNLSLPALLEILSSARPLHEVLRSWQSKRTDDDDADGFQTADIVDPHKKVDTSGFLVKRVQRACRALLHLRKRLESPLLSEGALAWRLEGPVGVRAVVEAIHKDCNGDFPDAWAFLLCELIRELMAVKLVRPDGTSVSGALRSRYNEFLIGMRNELPPALQSASAAMQTYAEKSLGLERA